VTDLEQEDRMTTLTKPTVEMLTIGPEEARRLLDSNAHNRRLRIHQVEQIKGAMIRGEWVFNGDAIRISEDGDLLDGQHRLAAIEATGLPQEMMVISGLPRTAQETMDAGAKRNCADVLRLRGETDVNRLAAVLRIVQHYETRKTFRPPVVQSTTQELLATLERHPGTREALVATRPVLRNTQFAGGPAGACYYLFSLVDPVDTEVFFTHLAMGTDLTSEDPIRALRRQFTNPRPVGNRVPGYIQGALTIKAFNYWRRGESVRLLQWRPGGATAEKFPVIDGLDLGHSNGEAA
jgi:hypothetical protein